MQTADSERNQARNLPFLCQIYKQIIVYFPELPLDPRMAPVPDRRLQAPSELIGNVLNNSAACWNNEALLPPSVPSGVRMGRIHQPIDLPGGQLLTLRIKACPTPFLMKSGDFRSIVTYWFVDRETRLVESTLGSF